MQVSIKWLIDYIDFTETPEQLADKAEAAKLGEQQRAES